MCRIKTLDGIHSKNNQRFKGFTKGIHVSSLDTMQFVCDTKETINYKVAAFNIGTKEPGSDSQKIKHRASSDTNTQKAYFAVLECLISQSMTTSMFTESLQEIM